MGQESHENHIENEDQYIGEHPDNFDMNEAE